MIKILSSILVAVVSLLGIAVVTWVVRQILSLLP